MYSVLIQNNSTISSFQKYKSLFLEYVNENRLGVCKWNEGGTTIDTALPGITELTNDQENWRAVIVRMKDDEAMSGFECDIANPYEFHENTFSDELSESSVPLIRLTHILGGVPEPEIVFEEKRIQKDFEQPVSAFVAVKNKTSEYEYNEICKKYQFDGNPPSEILLITARKGYVEPIAGNDRIFVRESMSSEFWKNNRYPSICRFTVFDFSNKGPVKRDAEEFGFWMSVLLMSINDEPTNYIKAYKLYRIQSLFNVESMSNSFQYTYNKLRAAKQLLEKSIALAIKTPDSVETVLPEYQYRVTVDTKYAKEMSRERKDIKYGTFTESNSQDIAVWDQNCKENYKGIENSQRIARRTLNQTADIVKPDMRYAFEEVAILDKYQFEDMNREIDQIHSEIVMLQGKLSIDNDSFKNELSEKANSVKENLMFRTRRFPVFLMGGVAFLLLLSAKIPAIINYLFNNVGNPIIIAGVSIAELLLIIISSFIVLQIQQRQLRKKIQAYNAQIDDFYERLTESSIDYSRYMSSIVSHSRACSYVDLSERSKLISHNSLSEKYRHVHAIESFKTRIRKWSKAFGAHVDFDYPVDDITVTMEALSLAPDENTLYTFESGLTYDVELNNSGSTLVSPFSFVDKLEIIREELYENNN